MKKQVAIYIRVSSSKQAQEGDSLDGQRHRIKAFAESNNMTIAQEYSDTASGYSETVTRRGLEQMLSDIVNGHLDVSAVLVYKFSRFARNVVNQESKIRILEDCGVELISITEPMPTTANMGKLLRVLFGAINEQQSDQNGAVVRDRLEETAAKGFFTGGRVPFGYTSIDVRDPNLSKRRRKLVINEDEVKVAQLIFNLAADGLSGRPMGTKAIAAHLNDNGFGYRNKAKFNRNVVNRILRNSCYKGKFKYKSNASSPDSIAITVPVAPIVSKEVFERVQRGLDSRKLKNTDIKAERSSLLLTGILKCSCCGSSMVSMTGKSGRYQYYRCSKKLRESVNSCSSPNIRVELADSIVMIEVFPKIFNKQFIQQVLESAKDIMSKKNKKAGANKLQLKKKICELEQQLHTLYSRLSNPEFQTDDYFNEHIKGLKTQLKSTKQALEKLTQMASLPFWKFGIDKIDDFLHIIADIRNKDIRETVKSLLISVVDEIVISEHIVTASGKRIVLLSEAAKKRNEGPETQVPSFGTIWRRARDSNSR